MDAIVLSLLRLGSTKETDGESTSSCHWLLDRPFDNETFGNIVSNFSRYESIAMDAIVLSLLSLGSTKETDGESTSSCHWLLDRRFDNETFGNIVSNFSRYESIAMDAIVLSLLSLGSTKETDGESTSSCHWLLDRPFDNETFGNIVSNFSRYESIAMDAIVLSLLSLGSTKETDGESTSSCHWLLDRPFDNETFGNIVSNFSRYESIAMDAIVLSLLSLGSTKETDGESTSSCHWLLDRPFDNETFGNIVSNFSRYESIAMDAIVLSLLSLGSTKETDGESTSSCHWLLDRRFDNETFGNIVSNFSRYESIAMDAIVLSLLSLGSTKETDGESTSSCHWLLDRPFDNETFGNIVSNFSRFESIAMDAIVLSLLRLGSTKETDGESTSSCHWLLNRRFDNETFGNIVSNFSRYESIAMDAIVLSLLRLGSMKETDGESTSSCHWLLDRRFDNETLGNIVSNFSRYESIAMDAIVLSLLRLGSTKETDGESTSSCHWLLDRPFDNETFGNIVSNFSRYESIAMDAIVLSLLSLGSTKETDGESTSSCHWLLDRPFDNETFGNIVSNFSRFESIAMDAIVLSLLRLGSMKETDGESTSSCHWLLDRPFDNETFGNIVSNFSRYESIAMDAIVLSLLRLGSTKETDGESTSSCHWLLDRRFDNETFGNIVSNFSRFESIAIDTIVLSFLRLGSTKKTDGESTSSCHWLLDRPFAECFVVEWSIEEPVAGRR